jgi:hypothetical protein
MSTKKPKASPDRATPKLRINGRTDKARVTATQALSAAMPQSPDWPQATEAHSALQLVTNGSDALAANAALLVNLRTQVTNAVLKQIALRHDWEVAVGKLLSTVEVFCNGAAEKVAAFGLDVQTRVQHGPQPAPAGLTVKAGTAVGQVVATWTRGGAGNGFIVQHATDPANAATYSVLEPSTKSHVTISGLPSGSLVHVRVAAVDPKVSPALGPWSEWATGTVR